MNHGCQIVVHYNPKVTAMRYFVRLSNYFISYYAEMIIDYPSFIISFLFVWKRITLTYIEYDFLLVEKEDETEKNEAGFVTMIHYCCPHLR